MDIENIRNILKDNLINELILINKKPWLFNKNQIILKQLNNKYNNFFNSFSELFYLIQNKNNLENLHIFCPICGNKNSFRGINKGYAGFCSTKCVGISPDISNKIKQTNLLKYNSISPLGNKNIQNKIIQTNFKKFGCKYISQSKLIREKINKTMKEKYGHYFNNLEKIKQTCLKKYGVPHFENIQKRKITCLNKYNVDNVLKSNIIREKISTTCLNKYGVDSYSKTKDYKLKRKLKYNDTIIKQRNTCLQKYGVDNYTKSKEYKNYMKNENIQNKRKLKEYETKKKNGTFNSSKIENKIYLKLKEKFSDTIHIYRDKKYYPYNCDFYIPTKDLFIELNFHWTHGKEPFDKNNKQHLEKLNDWKNKSKNSKFYKQAIYVWTELDVRKLENFKKNNLNYKIFYTEEKFNNWFSKLN